MMRSVANPANGAVTIAREPYEKSCFRDCGLLALMASSAASAAEPTCSSWSNSAAPSACGSRSAARNACSSSTPAAATPSSRPRSRKNWIAKRAPVSSDFRMTGDKLEAPRCDDVALTIGGHRFTIPVAGVYQVGEFNAKGVTVDGLVALDIFEGRTITHGFRRPEADRRDPGKCAGRIASATELPARLIREMGGYALTDRRPGPEQGRGHLGFEIDSGNGGTILVAKPYARPSASIPTRARKWADSESARASKRRDCIMPAGITLDGNLGMPFLKNYLVTVDLDKGRVWLQPNPTSRRPAWAFRPRCQRLRAACLDARGGTGSVLQPFLSESRRCPSR